MSTSIDIENRRGLSPFVAGTGASPVAEQKGTVPLSAGGSGIGSEQATAIPFHLSLNVANLDRSVEFFKNLFDLEPAKRQGDYAKFEVESPPLVLSLEPFEASAAAPLNHLGIRVPNSEQLVELQRRLEVSGISCRREDGVECCYARQTKFWVSDPDRNLWEIYTLEEDLDHRGIGQLPVVERPPELTQRSPAPAIWVHRLGDPIAERLLVESATVDQVLLQGSFNQRLDARQRQHLLAEARRILKPGAQLTAHGLSADRALGDIRGRLPGPAASVECIPAAEELIAELESAEFEGMQLSKLDNAECLTINGLPLRETRIVCYRRGEQTAKLTHAVLYKGPFRSLQDDSGRSFTRGKWVLIDEQTSERLMSSPIGEQFLFRDSPA
jgi:catechol 2,3-dioxygenase-like lactoylglutathione lyase family enzyme